MSDEQQIQRRAFLQALGILGAVTAIEGVSGATKRLPGLTISRPGPDDPPIPNEAVQQIYDQRFGKRPIQRGHVTLDMPAMAEDGRYVPVIIESNLPATPDEYVKHLYLIVDHNPDPLVTAFHFGPALGAVNLQTRIKMKRTSWIRAIAETSKGELWADYLKVETTLNGCG